MVFNVDYPSDSDHIKYRAVQWAVTEIMLAVACIVNLLPPKYFRWIFYASSGMVLLDFVLNMIWLPIGVAQTYGFRTAHEAFMTTYNGTGAPAGWNWCLSYLATAGILIGFDASGHVAEETRNASMTAARGIFWSTVVSGIGGFVIVILFLFCVVSHAGPPAGYRVANHSCSLMQIPSSSSGLSSHLCLYMPWFWGRAGTWS